MVVVVVARLRRLVVAGQAHCKSCTLTGVQNVWRQRVPDLDANVASETFVALKTRDMRGSRDDVLQVSNPEMFDF